MNDTPQRTATVTLKAIVQCDRCASRFPSPAPISDLQAYNNLLAKGGVLPCPRCHHFVCLGDSTLTLATDDLLR